MVPLPSLETPESMYIDLLTMPGMALSREVEQQMQIAQHFIGDTLEYEREEGRDNPSFLISRTLYPAHSISSARPFRAMQMTGMIRHGLQILDALFSKKRDVTLVAPGDMLSRHGMLTLRRKGDMMRMDYVPLHELRVRKDVYYLWEY